MRYAKVIALSLVILLAFPFAGHSTTETITLRALTETLELEVGKAAQLEWEVSPVGAALCFESADPAVAAVDEGGEVTGVAAGETVVTLSAGSQAVDIPVLVLEPAPPAEPAAEPEEPVELELLLLVGEAEVHLSPGEVYALSVGIVGEPESELLFESDDEAVAAVDELGVVSALSVGEAVITVSLGELYETVDLLVSEEVAEGAAVVHRSAPTPTAGGGSGSGQGGSGSTAASNPAAEAMLASLQIPADTVVPGTAAADEVDLAAYAYEVFERVNRERAKAGLSQVSWNGDLALCADIRAEEMNRKWGHERPNPPQDSSKTWPANVSGVGVYNAPSVADELGIPYSWVMENAGMGYRTPEAVVQGWMNSSGHRDNILRASHTRCGVGVYRNASGTYYWALWLDADAPSGSNNNANNSNGNTGNTANGGEETAGNGAGEETPSGQGGDSGTNAGQGGDAGNDNKDTSGDGASGGENGNTGNGGGNADGGSQPEAQEKTELQLLTEELRAANYSLSETRVTLTVGDVYQVPFQLSGVTDNITVVWSAGSNGAATVDGNGLVTAHRAGYCLVDIKIHVRGVYLDTRQCEIYVVDPEPEPEPEPEAEAGSDQNEPEDSDD